MYLKFFIKGWKTVRYKIVKNKINLPILALIITLNKYYVDEMSIQNFLYLNHIFYLIFEHYIFILAFNSKRF